jgi:hypothetical protein
MKQSFLQVANRSSKRGRLVVGGKVEEGVFPAIHARRSIFAAAWRHVN